MTRNNAKKKTTRKRMAQTGEKYAVALRKTEAAVIPEITVWPLGEDSEVWFVEGTDNEQEAIQHINDWILENVPEDYFLDEWPLVLEKSEKTVRDDWFWVPLYEEYPDDESILHNKTVQPEAHKGQTLMVGVYVTV